MKFAPIYAVAALLLLAGCALPAPPDVTPTSNPKIIFETGGVPNPAQTTWSTPEPTPTVRATEDGQVGMSTLTTASCGEIDSVLVFRFERSLVKCPELLALRAQLIEEVGEERVDAALLDYHGQYCTEHGAKKQGVKPLPHYTPSEPEFHEKPVDPNRDLGNVSGTNADSLEMNLGKYVPCMAPEEVAKQ